MSDLFTLAESRFAQSHSNTSVKAIKSITDSGVRKTQKDKIYEHMDYLSQEGLTIRGASNHFQLGMHVASARMRELEADGRIIKTAMERKENGSTSDGSVYVVKHRYTPEMGSGFTKESQTKRNYQKLKEVVEFYSNGQADGGIRARQILNELHPEHSNPLGA